MVYNVTQYSEATLIVKPTIYITVQVSDWLRMCSVYIVIQGRYLRLWLFVLSNYVFDACTASVITKYPCCLANTSKMCISRKTKLIESLNFFQEICETHQLLLDYKEILAPDNGDPLHQVLAELGERPSVQTLIGEALGESLGTLLLSADV